MNWQPWRGRVQLSDCGRYRLAAHGNRQYAIVFAGYRRDPRAVLQSLGRFDRADAATNIDEAREACDRHALAGGAAPGRDRGGAGG